MLQFLSHSGKGKNIDANQKKIALRQRGEYREDELVKHRALFRALKLFCVILSLWLQDSIHLSKKTEFTE